ncbi:MAG: PE family protein, partial [Mycobacterium gordonae]|nr:PE family protein [Mycobacterium gordonae]
MSFVIVTPENIFSAATDLAGIASTLNAADVSAAAHTTGILAAAEDDVSAAIAATFSHYALGYQALSTHAAAFQQQFLRALTAGAGAYAAGEAANASPMQQLLAAINAPVQALTGRPLIGNGADGAPGTGANGAPGGWLLGDGGAGGSGAPATASTPGGSGGAGGAAGLLGSGGAGGAGGSTSFVAQPAGAGGAGGSGGWLSGNAGV